MRVVLIILPIVLMSLAPNVYGPVAQPIVLLNFATNPGLVKSGTDQPFNMSIWIYNNSSARIDVSGSLTVGGIVFCSFSTMGRVIGPFQTLVQACYGYQNQPALEQSIGYYPTYAYVNNTVLVGQQVYLTGSSFSTGGGRAPLRM